VRGLWGGERAGVAGAEPRAGADPERHITGVAALARATPHDLVFLDNTKYSEQAAATAAGVCLTGERLTSSIPQRISVLRTAEPYRAFVEVARALFPDALRPSSLFEAVWVGPVAFVPPSV